MNKNNSIHPYLDKILDKGIKTQDPIDPVLHSCAFKLNIEKRNEMIVVECNFSNAEVYYYDKSIATVQWISNGCRFEVKHRSFVLMDVVASVLETIQEIRDIH